MRCCSLKAGLLLMLICGWALADEASDRVAIRHTIAQLNQPPWPAALFTADSEAATAIDEMSKGKRLKYRLRALPLDGPVARAAVTISHEPWGEVSFPGLAPMPAVEVVNPTIESSGAIQFAGNDVALADGVWTYRDDPNSAAAPPLQVTPLLFVMKRDGAVWKIAAVRVLATRARP